MAAKTGPGSLLAGRYQVERLLGEGAAGTVWFVRDTRQKGSTWALKELDFSTVPLDERDEARKLFDREAAILVRLSHPYLPRVVDRFHLDEREYLVMERVEGPTLEHIYRTQKSLQENEVAGWGAQVCEVLDYLHSLDPPVIYRDLKPANVMVMVRGGAIKLVDFGIARAMSTGKAGDTTAYGTPGYAPPEQYMGRAVPQSDLYALGATLYQLLTRVEPRPFDFEHRPARSVNPDISPGMGDLLDHLLAVESADRPATAREVQERLLSLAGQTRTWVSKAMSRLGHWVNRRQA